MTRALAAGLACLLLMALPAQAGTAPATLPFAQGWVDTGLISADDDWSGVTGIVGYRGDGLAGEPGSDPRGVSADGSGTPVDVTANLTDPRAVGLAAGVAEFELADPVVAIQGSATASAPHLVLSLDTSGRVGVSVRMLLRDIDATAHDAVEPVALQYRVGSSGPFAGVPGGYVADATSGPSEATRVSRLSVNLPAAADDQPLVQVRVLDDERGRTGRVGRDRRHRGLGGRRRERLLRTAGAGPRSGAAGHRAQGRSPFPSRSRRRAHRPNSPAWSWLPPPSRPRDAVRRSCTMGAPEPRCASACHARRWCDSKWSAAAAHRRTSHRSQTATASRLDGRAGAAQGRAPASGGRFNARGRRGLNRLRFSGRVRARPLAPGAYVLQAVAVDRAGRKSAAIAAPLPDRRRGLTAGPAEAP